MAAPGRAAGLLAAVLFCIANPALAQVGASVSVVSDYLYRGASLSDGQPAASLGISYDHASGAYGGLTVSAVKTRDSGFQPLGYVAVIGYAHRVGDAASWDVGVINREVSVYFDRRYSYNYSEIFAGFSKRNISTHIYFAPKYNRRNESTVYVDLDGVLRPKDGWRLLGHVGVTTTLSPDNTPFEHPTRFDLRAAVARAFGNGEVQLAGIINSPRPEYPEGRRQRRETLQARVTVFF